MSQVSDIRREYDLAKLDESQLAPDPIQQFNLWLKEAVDAGLKDPTAMTVATVDVQGRPSQRIVLLKDVDADGFIFYTNTESKKAQDLAENPHISLHFPWHNLERQVKIMGKVEPLSVGAVTRYFLSRPKESQLAAWASAQSRPVSSRQVLMTKFNEMKEKFTRGDVPLPSFWGGYRVIPQQIEFWQGGEFRLHDRFQYTRGQGPDWDIKRLMP